MDDLDIVDEDVVESVNGWRMLLISAALRIESADTHGKGLGENIGITKTMTV